MTTPTLPALKIATRICPTCGKAMTSVGNAWVCPTARTEARRISERLRAAIRADAYAIDPSCGF